MYVLGVISGILIAIMVEIMAFIVLRNNVHKIERFIQKNKEEYKEKGEVFYDTDEKLEFEEFIGSLPKE